MDPTTASILKMLELSANVSSSVADVAKKENNIVSADRFSENSARLSGGLNEYSGRVEICVNQEWGEKADRRDQQAF